MKTKFPLLRKIEIKTTHFTLEGAEEKADSQRRIILTGNNFAACQQYLMAMIHYGNIMELPFIASGVYDNENMFTYAHDALYEYFSSNKMLTAKARELRKGAYDQLEVHIFNNDYMGFDTKLASFKITKKIVEVDAEDIELEE